jgi:hypothetical protein
MQSPLRRFINRDRPRRRAANNIAALRMSRDASSINPPVEDDYLVEGEELPDQPSIAARVVRTLQFVLIIVLAALSLAVFWLFATILGII